jgi:hypothetical protein
MVDKGSECSTITMFVTFNTKKCFVENLEFVGVYLHPIFDMLYASSLLDTGIKQKAKLDFVWLLYCLAFYKEITLKILHIFKKFITITF